MFYAYQVDQSSLADGVQTDELVERMVQLYRSELSVAIMHGRSFPEHVAMKFVLRKLFVHLATVTTRLNTNSEAS